MRLPFETAKSRERVLLVILEIVRLGPRDGLLVGNLDRHDGIREAVAHFGEPDARLPRKHALLAAHREVIGFSLAGDLALGFFRPRASGR